MGEQEDGPDRPHSTPLCPAPSGGLVNRLLPGGRWAPAMPGWAVRPAGPSAAGLDKGLFSVPSCCPGGGCGYAAHRGGRKSSWVASRSGLWQPTGLGRQDVSSVLWLGTLGSVTCLRLHTCPLLPPSRGPGQSRPVRQARGALWPPNPRTSSWQGAVGTQCIVMLTGVEENQRTSSELAPGPCQALGVGPGQARPGLRSNIDRVEARKQGTPRPGPGG